MKMKILITGGAGLVGSNSAEFYALKGDKVIVLDNLMRSSLFGYDKKSVEYNWNYLSQFKNIKRVKGDVRNEEDVFSALGGGVDAVIHTAGQPGVPLSVKVPKDDFSINAYGTLNVLECLRKVSPQAAFVYCSTNKVYGENVDKIPLLEKKTRYAYRRAAGVSEKMSVDLTGHSPYGVSKLAGDLYAQEYGRIYKMRTAVFRMSCTYGTRQFGFEDQGWVAWFVIATLQNRPITIYGNGKQVRDLLNVSDLVAAFDKFICSDMPSAVYNIGGGAQNALSLLEFIKELEERTGKRAQLTFSNWRPSDQKVYITDITKVKRALKWRPKVRAQEGMKKLISWVKENENLW